MGFEFKERWFRFAWFLTRIGVDVWVGSSSVRSVSLKFEQLGVRESIEFEDIEVDSDRETSVLRFLGKLSKEFKDFEGMIMNPLGFILKTWLFWLLWLWLRWWWFTLAFDSSPFNPNNDSFNINSLVNLLSLWWLFAKPKGVLVLFFASFILCKASVYCVFLFLLKLLWDLFRI